MFGQYFFRGHFLIFAGYCVLPDGHVAGPHEEFVWVGLGQARVASVELLICLMQTSRHRCENLNPAGLLMPTYEYSCQKCGQTFEAFQSMRDEPYRECPKELCRLPKWGHGKVKRLLGTGAGLIFKGSGFYSTDYRSESYKAAAKKESAPKTSEGGDKSSKAESAKPPASSDTKAAAKKPPKESA
jgi:putative FmdB family regulatory protein